MQPITPKLADDMTKAWLDAEAAANASLGVGRKFLGAFHIADALGYQRETLLWSIAVQSAARVFQKSQIFVDCNGVQVGA